jgi:hypothetical protein
VTDYCRDDVAATRELFEFGRQKGHLIYLNREGHAVRLPVQWDLDEVVEAAKVAASAVAGRRPTVTGRR